MIGVTSSVGGRQKRVALSNPGPAVPDGDGGYTQTPVALVPPQLWAAIRPASTRDLESLTADTVVSQATHVVTVPYHPQITTQTELSVDDYPRPARRFAVTAVLNPNERNAELILICSELVP